MPLQANSKKDIDALESLREIRNMLEKRSRNLEKKKNKLDVYKEKWDKGEKLNEDQTKAVERLDGVTKQIEIVMELLSHVTTALDVCEKSGKKKEKRDRYEKERQDVSSFARLTEIQTMLQEIEDIRDYFTTGEHGTVCLAESELELLDDLYKALNPSRAVGETGSSFSERLKQTGDFIVNLLEGRDRASNISTLAAKVTEEEGNVEEGNTSSTTYKELKDLVDKVLGCDYFTGQKTVIEQDQEEEVNEVHEEVEEVPETLCDPIENRNPSLLNGDTVIASDEVVPTVENFGESSESEEPLANGTDVEEESVPVGQSRPIASWSEVAAADGDKKNSGLSDMIDHLQSNYTFLVESRLDSTTPTNPSPTPQLFVEQPVQNQVAAPKPSTTSAPIPVPAKKSTWADDSDLNASGSWADEPIEFAHSPVNAPVTGPTESRAHAAEIDIFASASQSDYLQSGGDECEDGGGSWQQQHPRSSGHRGGGGRGGFRRDRERGSGGPRGFRGSRGGGGGYRGRGGNWNNERGSDRGWNSRGGGNMGSGGYRGGSGGGPYRGGNYRSYRSNFEYTASSGSNF